MTVLYDPLTWENLMAGLAARFEQIPLVNLTSIEQAHGPGVYALFYDGPHPAYKPIAGTRRPIYVGKAVSTGTRKGTGAESAPYALRNRLRLHRRSVDTATNLDVGNFRCRYLAVVPVWITLAERFLIDHYRPIWNIGVDGFGNNPQGKHRSRGDRSWWDILHPGRLWASTRTPKGSEEEAIALVAQFFAEVQSQ